MTLGGDQPPSEQLHPRGVGEVLDAAIKLYTRNLATLWKIVAVVIVPLVIIDLVIVDVTLPTGAFVHHGTLYTSTGTLGTPGGAVVAEIVLRFLAAVLVQGALCLCLVDAYVGRPLDWRQSLRAGLARLGPLVWLGIIYGICVVIGLILIVAPGIWLIVVWSAAVPALMFEKLGGAQALRRSFRLVRHRWFATFAEILVALIMLIVVLFVVGLIIAAIEKGLKVNSTGLWLAFSFVSTIISDLIALPFLAAVTAVIYIDLRVRKEALDLELLARGPGAAPEPVALGGGPAPVEPQPGGITGSPQPGGITGTPESDGITPPAPENPWPSSE
jgi:hypothetical protein